LAAVAAGWSGFASASLPRAADYDPKADIARYGSLHLNTRYLTSSATRRKTACHELGHAFGLEHRRGGRTCMRDGFTTLYGHPDGTDYANLRRICARP
jgi:hypothetical protein